MIISSIIGGERTLRKGHPLNFTVGKQAQGRQELVPGHTVAVGLPWEEALGGPEGEGWGLRALDRYSGRHSLLGKKPVTHLWLWAWPGVP